ncbi:hypothetical protein DH2020_038542 [Rehmannia glutinosa]|uniref:Uncharacterized protein n=1 Tax=Rehmannia glutinosa TaxID=99300 RepID=A0ABR0UZK2_REHGL
MDSINVIAMAGGDGIQSYTNNSSFQNTLSQWTTFSKVVRLKYLNTNHEIPDFQVYFSDHAINDFNTLFKSLLPIGSITRRAFRFVLHPIIPTCIAPHCALCSILSIGFLNCQERLRIKILVFGIRARYIMLVFGEEVINAYSRQHAIDFSKFLEVRAQEMVPED